MKEKESAVAHYSAQYGDFASQLYSEIRAETYGEDSGQNGWLTRRDHDVRRRAARG